MVFGQQPLIVLSTGLRPPEILPAALGFAQAIQSEVRMLLRVPQRTDDAMLLKYAAVLRETLPSELHDLPIEPVRAKNVAARLEQIAQTEGGLIALQPSRRNVLSAIIRNDFERLLIEGSLPILSFPAQLQLTSIQRVLFPADFSPRSLKALDIAIALCQKLGAELHLLHVFGPDQLLPSEVDQERRMAAQSPRELFNIDQESLNALAERAIQAGISTSAITSEGRAHTKILDYAASNTIDLIVLGTHGPRSSEDIVRGSTSARVALHSKRPVLSIQC